MLHFSTARCFILFLILLISPIPFPAGSALANQNLKPLQVLRITPDGQDVPAGRQIVFQFNRPVVPVGRMQREASEIPIDITPALNCQWRWLNASALACQLGDADALVPATQYKIRMDPGITAEDGAGVKQTLEHSFITERPKVRHAWFRTWKSPGTPYIRMTFNQPVSQLSVEQHVFMSAAGAAKKRVALTAVPDPSDKTTPFILPLPGEKQYLITGSSQSAQKQDDKTARKPVGIEARRVWMVYPEAELGLDQKVLLQVEPGLVSFLGPEKGAEERVVIEFYTFPEFAFEGVECADIHDKKISLTPDTPPDDSVRCNPLGSVALVFSAPVIEEEVKNHVVITPHLAGGRTDYDPWAHRRGYSRLRSPHARGRKYRVWLPEVLKADAQYHIRSHPQKFQDEFGRALATPIDMQFGTDHRRPDFALTHPRAVLEKAIDTELPLVVTNLETVSVTYDRLTAGGKDSARILNIPAPVAADVAVRIPLQVRDMLGDASGVIQGRVDASPPVSKHEWDRWFFAQVTPFQVHVKAGHFNTLVWVTDLSSAKPVAGATVKIYKDTYSALTNQPDILAQAETNAAGEALLAGTEAIDPELKFIRAYRMQDMRLFVRVEKNGDLALIPLDHQFRVDTYRASRYTVSSRMRRRYGHIHTWGTTAQGVYKAGDTIQYKLYVRNQSNESFVPAPRKEYSLKVVDPMGKTAYEVSGIVLSEFGAHHGEFNVPKTGAVGWYRFQLSADFSKWTWTPMRVLVSDFTPAPFRVATELNAERFQPQDRMQVSTRARLHAGGPYTGASARVTVSLQSKTFESNAPVARGFRFDTHVPGSRSRQTLHQTDGFLDSNGDLVSNFTLSENDIIFGNLTVESAVRDDRGKNIAGRMTADYASRDRLVGVRSTRWVLDEDAPAAVDILVVDQLGQPVAGTPVTVRVERRETKAARVKGAGNAYLTQYTHQWVAVSDCELVSNTQPAACQFTPDRPGSYRIHASIQDTRDRPHSSQLHQYVVGKGRVIWPERADNSLEIIAEKPTYQVGDKARYLIKNPFPGATALVTIERYGVLKTWVQTLDSGTPVIEFEVHRDFIPGFFLSVVVVSPRVDQPPGAGQVDLGKPAFRMGYVKVPVTDPYKQVAIKVSPARDTYKPRERVKVKIQATPRHADQEEPVELAVVVLDESVLDLISRGKSYFDPYNGFYTIDGLDLENFSLLMRLVGRQKFEKKGANTGGGGGPDLSLRSVFKFVSYWNPSLVPDADGKASIEFDAPDNLTGWRVLVLATTPGDRMGLGDAAFKVNRPTEIRPVMPNQVTQGDGFLAGFSIMNRTATQRNLTLTIAARGVLETDPGKALRQHSQTIAAEPYQRYTVWMPVQTMNSGRIHFTVRGGDGLDTDSLTHSLTVHKRESLHTAATYGASMSGAVRESIHFPQNIRTDVGQVSVVLAPSVLGNLEGAFGFMRDYEYICWEQILTRGVMASHFQNLKQYMSAEFKWPNSQKLPREMLDRAAAYQAPNGGMAYYIPQNRYVSPYLSAYTAIAFNWLRAAGYQIPVAVENKLHGYLKDLLRRNVMPDFYSRGMASSVRAVALAALARHAQVNLSDLRRYRLHLPEMSLFGKAHFLLAAIGVNGSENIRTEVCHLILSHAGQSGEKFVFSETIDDSYSRILSSNLRTNAAVLSALTAYAGTPGGNVLVGDVPVKLVRYITQTRKNRDHWENTQENMFCMNALVDFSRVYEHKRPDMTLRAVLDAEEIGSVRFADLRDQPVEIRQPIGKQDPGRTASLTLEREGQGRIYYGLRLFYAPLQLKADPVNAGIEIHREYSVERNGRWSLLENPMRLARGELVRVDLFVSLPTARNFVVVADPVPGGLEPVNRDLATASVADADKGEFLHAGGSWWFRYSDWSSYGRSRWSFYHQELRHDSVRFYSEYLPAGNYQMSYTAQAIAPGNFAVMPVHSEEMYDPDVYGKGVGAKLVVRKE